MYKLSDSNQDDDVAYEREGDDDHEAIKARTSGLKERLRWINGGIPIQHVFRLAPSLMRKPPKDGHAALESIAKYFIPLIHLQLYKKDTELGNLRWYQHNKATRRSVSDMIRKNSKGSHMTNKLVTNFRTLV